jgi:alginate O-acetyltransferase complex protein AlgI
VLFNSVHFVIFFPIVLIIFYRIPHRFRWFFLLLASYYFYGSWHPWYLLLIVGSTLVDYFAAINISKTEVEKFRKRWLYMSLIINLGVLFVFKYFNFFIDSAREWLNLVGLSVPDLALTLVLPIGISFYTFQTISYTIDVYRRQIEPEKHLGYFALYVSFFPQLVAGPIERARTLQPQFRKKVNLTLPDVQEAMNLIAYGFFKKLVVADRLAGYVGNVFEDTSQMSPLSILFGCLFFCVQVYCDFSGYSDIAIGTARLFGIRLMDNFDRPYLAKSLREFWRKWHMSLSQWIRDYVYIPLGGSRIGNARTIINLFITFILVGLWHGGYWSLVVWGAAHALGVAIERVFIGVKVNLPKPIINLFGRIWTLSFVALTFIVYAARDLEQAIIGLSELFAGHWVFDRKSLFAGGSNQEFQFCLLAVLLLAFSYAFPKKPIFTGKLAGLRNSSYFLIFTLLTFLLSTNDQIEFFYFQF